MFFFGQWWEISLESFSELQYLIDFLWFLDQMCTPCEIVNDKDEDDGDDIGHDDVDIDNDDDDDIGDDDFGIWCARRVKLSIDGWRGRDWE